MMFMLNATTTPTARTYAAGDTLRWYDPFDKMYRTVKVLAPANNGYVLTECDGVVKQNPAMLLATMTVVGA
jgi:hypothetical protein